jgi:hypothetical protein
MSASFAKSGVAQSGKPWPTYTGIRNKKHKTNSFAPMVTVILGKKKLTKVA